MQSNHTWGLRLYLKKDWQRCFPVNFGKFFRTHFSKNTTSGCFCLCLCYHLFQSFPVFCSTRTRNIPSWKFEDLLHHCIAMRKMSGTIFSLCEYIWGNPEAHSEHCQKSRMERFAKIFAKRSILDVPQSFQYTSDIPCEKLWEFDLEFEDKFSLHTQWSSYKIDSWNS